MTAAADLRRELHFGSRLLRCFAQRPRHVVAMLEAAVRERGAAEALACGGRRLSWQALREQAARCAGGLAARGVRAGDRVALHAGNGIEFVVTTLACAWLGAVLVPIGARARGPELQHVLADCEAVALVCDAALAAGVPPPEALPRLALRVAIGPAGEDVSGLLPFEALLQADAPPPHDAGEEDLAVLLYTSGTTGRPKGAMICQLNIVHSALHFARAMRMGPHDCNLVAVPLSHVTGLVGQFYTALAAQARLVLMTAFKAADMLALAARERVTHTIMVPAMYNLCLLQPDLASHDLEAWRVGCFGGAPMPTATIDALAARLPRLVLMNAYGATETASPTTIMPLGQQAAHRDSVGRVVECGEVCIMDEAGRELPPGTAGEVWIGGPIVVPGYWRNPEVTAREFAGGYWRSGDIGSVDAEGYVRILDRKKDVINRGGYKIFCTEVEGVLAEHPGVVESALVGVPCPVLGERVHATVCVRDEAVDAAVLRGFCAERMAEYAVPEFWAVSAEPLPRNLNGKVMKPLLRERAREAVRAPS